jgi:nicotinamidase-related amidase
MILESCNIKHIVIAGIETSGVVLTTVQSAADRDFRISVVRDCCFDGSDAVHKFVMDEVLPKYGVTVTSFDGIVGMLRA